MKIERIPGMVLLLCAATAICPASAAHDGWRELEPGLELGEFPSPVAARSGDSIVRVVRVDPSVWEFALLNTSAPGEGELHTAGEWCARHGCVAAINASMYQTDYRRSVSLMRTRDHANNTYVSKDNTILAFDRLDDTVPPVQIIDRTCQDFAQVSGHYGTLVQSIRMISCHGNNVWEQQNRRYSTAAIAIDGAGRLLMIHCRSPYSTYDFIGILQDLPLDIANAMYVEGGPESQLCVYAGGERHEFVGSFESGILESDLNRRAWPIPNVVSVRRRVGAGE
ncbi:phosphodiester glycosidase family protein [bacterium]|nr:phosphodiester glycosidase family protein [bacterium]MBU1072246.1 phosphodiester glycosidase family protein [bacterium]MBU1674382.1 phosphodiester glycosidase family protein [bacterium]